MRQSVYIRVLRRASEVLGGAEALRTYLGVSDTRLGFWLDGNLAPPDDVVFRLVDLVMENGASRAAPQQYPQDLAPEEEERGIEIRCAQQTARCARCDATYFTVAAPGDELLHMSMLKCANCGAVSTYGDLMVRLGADAVQHSSAAVVRLRKRQQQRLGASPGLAEDPSKHET
jgi:hypothetical protein